LIKEGAHCRKHSQTIWGLTQILSGFKWFFLKWERLAKTINTSLRANISESKFKKTKSKFKRSHKCQNPLIPTVNEVVWTKGIPNAMSYVLEILDY
jgi:hypothetical protein